MVVDSRTLAEGLMLVITPGGGGLARARGQRALSALSGADAALLADRRRRADQRAELGFLGEAVERVENVLIVVDRNDRQHGVHEVQSESEAHLLRIESAREQTSLLAICSRLKSRADRMRVESGPQDQLAAELERESGFPDLSALLDRLAAERRRLPARCSPVPSGGFGHRGSARPRKRAARQREQEQRASARAPPPEDGGEEGAGTRSSALRRELHNELRLLQREADASMATRLNAVRRDFDRRLAEGDSDDFEGDLEALL